jgi:hypothetical protein
MTSSPLTLTAPPFLRPANVDHQVLPQARFRFRGRLTFPCSRGQDRIRPVQYHLAVRPGARLATIIDWPTIIAPSGHMVDKARLGSDVAG